LEEKFWWRKSLAGNFLAGKILAGKILAGNVWAGNGAILDPADMFLCPF